MRMIEVIMGQGWRDRLRKAVAEAGFTVDSSWQGPNTCGVIVPTKLTVDEFEEVLRNYLQFEGWMEFNEGERG